MDGPVPWPLVCRGCCAGSLFTYSSIAFDSYAATFEKTSQFQVQAMGQYSVSSLVSDLIGRVARHHHHHYMSLADTYKILRLLKNTKIEHLFRDSFGSGCIKSCVDHPCCPAIQRKVKLVISKPLALILHATSVFCIGGTGCPNTTESIQSNRSVYHMFITRTTFLRLRWIRSSQGSSFPKYQQKPVVVKPRATKLTSGADHSFFCPQLQALHFPQGRPTSAYVGR
jgi:hypothetical protein